MNTLITICARGGSKGVPGKNIKELLGKPLIGYAIDLAKQYADKVENTDIILSTDSEEIRRIAAQCGLDSDYIRPDTLANDKAGKVDAIADVLKYAEGNGKSYDYILDLDVTSPLRNLDDLMSAFEIIHNNDHALNLFSVSPAGRNPYFNMVEQKENGFYMEIKSANTFLSRQAAPVVYDVNGSFYFYKKSFFEAGYRKAITDRSLIYLVPHICFDIDHTIDFDIMELLMTNKKLDFTLE